MGCNYLLPLLIPRTVDRSYAASCSLTSKQALSDVASRRADNNGILQRRFESMVNEHLMAARARLDVRTLAKNKVMRDFRSAASLAHALGNDTFVIGELIDIFTASISLCTQMSMLWSLTTADNADLALVSLFSASVSMVRWFWRRRGITWSSITDKNYNRMSLMSHMSHVDAGTFGERKVLGLSDWVTREYKKASDALGDVSLAAPSFFDMFGTTTEALRGLTDTAIYVLFALKASSKPVGEATISMTSLGFIQNAARSVASGIYCLVRDVQHFGTEFAAFRAYYRILEIKPTILEPVQPVEYSRATRQIEPASSEGVAKVDDASSEENLRSGMDIEFRNVSFTWPGKREKALDGLSFHIHAGQLCAIVGYNGAGKSTLIALIARLVDPSSGQILINGHDIKSYRTADLHIAMTMLFQSSAELPLTLREFIGIGNLAEVDNMEKIRAAATEAGALDFIEKLKDGFESSFTGSAETETVDTLYKCAVDYDKDDDDSDTNDDSDDDGEDGETEPEADEKAKIEAGDDEKAEDDDETKSTKSNDNDEDGRLAFSGGQRQKLVMARSFMRQSDLAIFDE